MVKKLKLCPESDILLSLSSESPVRLYRLDGAFEPPWVIQRYDGRMLRIFVDYQYVEFKFECFSLMFKDFVDKEIKDGLIGEMNAIKLYFKSEWSRPATPGEVPDNCVQIKRNSGPLSAIEDNAISSCISLVGISWENRLSDNSKQALFLDIDGDDPTDPIFIEEEKIIDYSENCDIIEPKYIKDWEDIVNKWMESDKVI